MPTYMVTDSQTGKKFKLTGDSPPTEQELLQIFAQHKTPASPRGLGESVTAPPSVQVPATERPRPEPGFMPPDTSAFRDTTPQISSPVAESTAMVQEGTPAQAPAAVALDPRRAVSPASDLGQEPDVPPPVEKERGFFGDVKESFKRGNEDTYLNSLYYDAMTGKRTIEDARKVEREFADRRKKDPVEADNWLEKIVFGASGAVPAMAQGVFAGQKLGAATGLTAAGLGAITGVGAAATGAVGYAAGSAVGATEHWRRLGAGSMFREMIGAGVNPEIAGIVAKVASLPYALIEQAQVSRYAPGLDKQLKKAVTKSLMKRIGKFATGRAIDIGVEDLQEGLQGGLAQVASDISAIIDPHLKDPKLDEAAKGALKRIGTDMLEALPTVIGLGAPKGIVGAAQIVGGEMAEQGTSAKQQGVTETTQLSPEEQATSDKAAKDALRDPGQGAGTVQQLQTSDGFKKATTAATKSLKQNASPSADVDAADAAAERVLKKFEGTTQPETTEEILNPTKAFFREEMSPTVRRNMEAAISMTYDDVLGMPTRAIYVNSIYRLASMDRPFSIGAADARNLGGLNAFFEGKVPDANGKYYNQEWAEAHPEFLDTDGKALTDHEGANVAYRMIIGNPMKAEIDGPEAQTNRIGGDEFDAVDAGEDAVGLLGKLERARDSGEKIAQSLGLHMLPHPKHDGLPTGFGLDVGTADHVSGIDPMGTSAKADALAGAAKEEFLESVSSRYIDENGNLPYIKDASREGAWKENPDYVRRNETEASRLGQTDPGGTEGETDAGASKPSGSSTKGTSGEEGDTGDATGGPGEGPPPTDITAQEQEAEDELPEAPRGVPKETTLQFLQRKIQDKFNRLTVVQNVKQPDLPEDQDAYLQQEVMHGKVESQINDIKNTHIAPVEKVLTKNKKSLDDLDEYLIAKHAAERNQMIWDRRPDWAEQGIPGSGMFSTQSEKDAAVAKNPALSDIPVAEDILNSPDAPVLEEAARHIWDMNKAALQQRVDSGLLSQEQADAFGQFKFYVPLRGEQGGEGETGAVGKGLSVGGKEFQRAKGRKSMAQSPTAFSVMQASEGVVRGEKNKVGQSFLKFVRENPDADMWEIDEKVTEPVFDEKKGEVVYRTGEQHPLPENVMKVKEGGKEYHITIKDPILARAMNNLGADKIGKGLQMIATTSRYLSMVNTSLVPEFVISNFSRDIQTSIVNIAGEDVSNKEALGLAGSVVKNVAPAMKGVWDAKRSKKQNKWTTYANEFSKAGGEIGFFGLENIDIIQKRLVSNLNAMKPGVKGSATKMYRGVRDLVMDVNGAVENATRLSTYIAMRERGMSKTKAASVAKNITVNFNKKGELGSAFNALYIFSNAGVQGTARLFKALKNPRVQAIVTAAAVGSFALAQLNRQVAGDDEDDGENYYDKVQDWVKENNIVIMKPGTNGEYYKIPVPYGYNVFWVLGQVADKVVHNPEKASQAAAQFGGAVMNAFNPLGGASTLLQMITPTVARPLVDLGLNKNFFGAPIVPKEKFGPEKAKSHRAFKSTSEPSQTITKALNEITGGTRYQPGYIDIPPDVIDYMVEYVGGGAGRTINQVINLGGKLGSKKDIPIREIPFARRFMGEIDERQDMQTFYGYLDKLAAIKSNAKHLRDTDPKKFKEFRAKNKMALQFQGWGEEHSRGTLGEYEKKIKEVRTRIKNNDSKGIDTSEDEDSLLKLMKRYNARIKQVLEAK